MAYDAYQHLLELTDPSLRPTRLVWGKKVVHCSFGNPFRPVTIDPAWKTRAVVQLARSMYEDRRFEDMPVLADALEEAGCQEAVVIEHCRGPGPHVRGCWLLDLILDKE